MWKLQGARLPFSPGDKEAPFSFVSSTVCQTLHSASNLYALSMPSSFFKSASLPCGILHYKGLCKYSTGYWCLHFKFPFQPLLSAGQTLPYLLWVIFLFLESHKLQNLCNLSHADFPWKCKVLWGKKIVFSMDFSRADPKGGRSPGMICGQLLQENYFLKRPRYRTAKLISKPERPIKSRDH